MEDRDMMELLIMKMGMLEAELEQTQKFLVDMFYGKKGENTKVQIGKNFSQMRDLFDKECRARENGEKH